MMTTQEQPANQQGQNGGRETRLLLATIAVSVLMLLLLARFRFPEEAARQTVEPAPAPLERLAARATFDELAGIMADLERRLAPGVTVLAQQSEDGASFMPAVRLASDRAVAVLPRMSRLAPLPERAPPQIVSRYATRELVVVQVDAGASAVPAIASQLRPGPRYVAVMEATPDAPVIRPVYIGRTELLPDPRWTEPVLRVGAVQQTLPIGSAIFSLDGGFIGLVFDTAGTAMVAPADALRALASAAPTISAVRGRLPIEVQSLTSSLSRATGAAKGVVVSFVPPDVQSNAGLAGGDVIQSVDGTPVATVADFQHVAHSRTPGEPVRLSIIRRGEPLTATLTALEDRASPGGPADAGLVLRTVPRVGSEIVDVAPDSAAERAGLRRGDLVVALDGKPAPTAGALNAAVRATGTEQPLLLTLRREGEHVVVALDRR
ncbi:MAG TPA: PDZ domain-containing protein [Vicinamibacterales bacterium]|nr:PDZ domain-containing protein [Vicinamibacterales bacterium]